MTARQGPRKYDTKVYRVLSHAARLGDPVPSLKDIALAVGCPVTGRGRMSQVIKRLEAKGRIIVQREDGLTVRITIVSTGYSTARVVKNRPGYMRPRAERPTAVPEPPKTRPAGRCQYIAGEPSADDACKHGAPTVPGSAYCAEHLEICYLRQPVLTHSEETAAWRSNSASSSSVTCLWRFQRYVRGSRT